MHETQEEVRQVIIYCTDFGEIEYPHMTMEQAESRYHADVTRYWFLLGDRTQAEMELAGWRFE